jgi:hypothetical protein
MKTRRSSGTTLALLIFAGFVGAFLYRYWPSDDRDIRRHLSSLAEALSLPAHEQEPVRLTRFAALREYFATDVRVHIDNHDIASRDALLEKLGHVSPPPEGLAVEVSEVRVQLAADRSSASVDLVARLIGERTQSGDRTLETRRLDVVMLKWQGDWVISRVTASPQ